MSEFLIAGCQRSGTTLMGLVLDSHPDIYCWGESSTFHKDSYAALRDRLPPPVPVAQVGYQIPIWTEVLVEYDCIRALARERRIVFLLRDVRATVASMATLANWLADSCERDGIHVWWNDPARVFRQRYQADLDFACQYRLRDERLDISKDGALLTPGKLALFIQGAIYWKYKTRAYFEMLAQDFAVLGLRYENLVRYPRRAIGQVLDFLRIPWHDDVLRHHIFCHDQADPQTRLTLGDTRADRPIDATSLDKWQSVLRPEHLAGILHVAQEMNDRLNADAPLWP